MNAIYAGSFDPFHNGHLDIFNKAREMFEEVIIVVASNPDKKSLIPARERADTIKAILGTRVLILPDNALLANYARDLGVNVLLRGLRNNTDFEYERAIERTNRMIWPRINSTFITCGDEFGGVSSSFIRGMLTHDDSQWPLLKMTHPFALSAANKYKFFSTYVNTPDCDTYDYKYYHNWTHLAYMVKELRKIRCNIDDSNIGYIVEHDIDDDSTAFNATQYPPDDEYDRFNWLRFADLKILAEPWENYLVYLELIKREYFAKTGEPYLKPIYNNWLKKKFWPARKKAMGYFLKNQIFHDSYSKYESRAKHNIFKELAENP